MHPKHTVFYTFHTETIRSCEYFRILHNIFLHINTSGMHHDLPPLLNRLSLASVKLHLVTTLKFFQHFMYQQHAMVWFIHLYHILSFDIQSINSLYCLIPWNCHILNLNPTPIHNIHIHTRTQTHTYTHMHACTYLCNVHSIASSYSRRLIRYS